MAIHFQTAKSVPKEEEENYRLVDVDSLFFKSFPAFSMTSEFS